MKRRLELQHEEDSHQKVDEGKVDNERTVERDAEDEVQVKRSKTEGDDKLENISPPSPPPIARPIFLTGRHIDYVRDPPNFSCLAQLDPSFSPFLRPHPTHSSIDWKNPSALLALTRSLLRVDFGLSFHMPLHHLCPPLPQRLAYVHWVAGLLEGEGQQGHKERRGVDVGCGASCVFGLLGAVGYGWRMVGTDIDEGAITAAQHNITDNGLDALIEVRLVKEPQLVLQGVLDERESFDFVMCNPPFFEREEQEQSQSNNPHRSTMSTLNEWSCEGGEDGFISRMFTDSIRWRKRIGWFTCMTGKKTTMTQWRLRLASPASSSPAPPPRQVRTTAFTQGKQTRWAIAWTWNVILT